MTLDYNNHYESDEHDDHWGIIDCNDHYEPFNHDDHYELKIIIMNLMIMNHTDYCDHDDFSDVP